MRERVSELMYWRQKGGETGEDVVVSIMRCECTIATKRRGIMGGGSQGERRGE